MRDFICIVCPRGCRLHIEEAGGGQYLVSGNRCPEGAAYARQEMLDPRRVLCSTVCIEGASEPRCPVRSREAIPKDSIPEAMAEIRRLKLKAPVRSGEVLIESLAGSGVPLIATRTFGRPLWPSPSEAE